jgi:cytoskeletal protein CcmA (bactofilin family)
MKLKGGTLLYVLLIALIIGALMGSYLLINSYQRIQLDRQWGASLARDNTSSAMALFFKAELQPNDNLQGPLFQESELDSFALKSEYWGMFGLLHSIGIHSKYRDTLSSFFGHIPTGEFRHSLFLEDQNQPLVIAGDTRLRGSLALPAAGIKSGIVGRRMYSGQTMHQGKLSSSKGKKLAFRPLGWEGIRDSLRKVHQMPKASEANRLRNMDLYQPWLGEPHRILAQGNLRLENVQLEGKCIVYVSGELTVASEAILNDVILIARQIHIEPGFEGRVQAFATENLRVDSNVNLKYPSLLMLAPQANEAVELGLAEGCSVEGAIIYDPILGGLLPQRNTRIFLAEGSHHTGHLVARHNLDLRGKVSGGVQAGNLLLQTPASRYNNYLMDASLNYDELPRGFVMPLLGRSRSYEMMCKLVVP